MHNDKGIINIEETDIPYEVDINSRLKYMRVSIGFEGMKVSVPRIAYLKDIEKFLRSKEDWIYRHYVKFKDIKKSQSISNWEANKLVQYKGISYPVEINEVEKNIVRADFDGRKVSIIVDRRLNIVDRKRNIELVLKKLFASKAKEYILQRLSYFSKLIGVTYNDVRIKEQKTRWGSCSKKGNLNFNWKIIMAPEWVADYVIVHELCHIKHLNHSRQFWDTVGVYMPNYKEARTWLKVNGIELNI